MDAPTRLLALDVGQARIGLAVGDAGSTLAFGRGALKRTKTRDDVQRLQELAHAEGASRIVVGLPTTTDGKHSKQTQRVRAFARELEKVGLDVIFEDERFTSELGVKDVAQQGLPKQKREMKGRVDEAAAIRILESYLQKTHNGDIAHDP
jgi:putative Holliday junction resolvase